MKSGKSYSKVCDKSVYNQKGDDQMTKLEQLLNEFYATEGLTLRNHLYEIEAEVDTHEAVNEFKNLLHWLNKKID